MIGDHGKAIRRFFASEIVRIWLLASVLAIAVWRHTLLFFLNDFIRSVQATQGILDGLPHWRVYQSRMLGPWATKAIGLFGPGIVHAQIILLVVCLAATAVVLHLAARRLGRSSGPFQVAFFFLVFVLLQGRPWLYVWDGFILLFGAAFLYLVIVEAKWWAFAALASVAFLNHESASFIALWMIVQPLADRLFRKRPLDRAMLVAGVAVAGLGYCLVEGLRDALLVREIGPEIFSDAGGVARAAAVHWQIGPNLAAASTWLLHPNFDANFVVPLFVIATIVFAGLMVLRNGARVFGLVAYLAVQIGTIGAFALLQETRVLLQLLPFFCLGAAFCRPMPPSRPIATD